jgi:hypothetical protein
MTDRDKIAIVSLVLLVLLYIYAMIWIYVNIFS